MISYYRPTHSCALCQYIVRIRCEHVLKCTVLPLQADPALGYVMYFCRKIDQYLWCNSRMDVVESTGLCHAGLSYLNSSPATASALLTVLHITRQCTGWAVGCLIPLFALNEMKNPASGFSCKPSRLLWIKLLNQSRETVPCCFIVVNTSSHLPLQQLKD